MVGWAYRQLEWLWQDARYGWRMVRHSPGFTAVALISLALGIGANTAIFSLINVVILRLLPVERPEELVELLQKYPGEPRGNGYWTRTSYEHIRDENHVFAGVIGAAGPARWFVRGGSIDGETVTGESVTGNYFSDLGVRPAFGRLIGPEDTATETDLPAAVLSWSLWKNAFHQDPAVLGKRLILENVPATIVGIAPRGFTGLQAGSKTEVWLPLRASAKQGLALMGRLKRGVTIEQARAEMSVLYRFTIEERAQNSKDPLIRQLKVEVEPGGAGYALLRDNFGTPLLLLMGIVGLLLLIACTNIASMLLARGAARGREMAVRVSLGARRTRLVRQVLTESILLAVAGSLLGLLLANFGSRALVRMLTSGRLAPNMPAHLEIDTHPDARVLLFTAGVALLTGLLFGFAPAWRALTSAPASWLRTSGSSGESRLGRLLGKGLVAAQVALSIGMLSAAGVFIQYLANLEHTDLGFRRDHVLLVSLDPVRGGYEGARWLQASQELLERFKAIPAVRTATISAGTPLSGAGASRFVNVEGHPERPEDRRYVSLNWVAPNYFETLGTPLLAGRDFTVQDRSAARVAIVNQAMARYYFAGASPIGRHFSFDGDSETYQIVGLVGDANYYEIREPRLRTIYLNASQDPGAGSQFILRTAIEPAAVAADVWRTLRQLLKTVPVKRITTLDDQVDASIVPERIIAALSGVFGGIGALLAAIGLYGLLAYTVARRTNEIGIRMALGATPADTVRMVIADALATVAVGLVAGVPLAIWGKRLATVLIPDLPRGSTAPVILGAAVMIAIALAAACVPARRAARVDPIAALHYE